MALDGFSSVVKYEKVPWEPFRSGVHMPDRRTPPNFSGGKVMGTRRTELKIPFDPRTLQNAWLLRFSFNNGFESGNWNCPKDKTREAF
jgi:hypothetical protein